MHRMKDCSYEQLASNYFNQALPQHVKHIEEFLNVFDPNTACTMNGSGCEET